MITVLNHILSKMRRLCKSKLSFSVCVNLFLTLKVHGPKPMIFSHRVKSKSRKIDKNIPFYLL